MISRSRVYPSHGVAALTEATHTKDQQPSANALRRWGRPQEAGRDAASAAMARDNPRPFGRGVQLHAAPKEHGWRKPMLRMWVMPQSQIPREDSARPQ